MSRTTFLGSAVAVVLVAAAAPSSAHSQTPASDSTAIPASARQEIAHANAAWLQAMKAGDAATVAAPYSDSGIFVSPGGQVFRGRQAVENYSRARFRAGGRAASGTIVEDGLTRAGPMIYEWGHVELRLADAESGAEPLRGRYLTVWAREADGRWHIIRNLSLP